MDFKAMSVRRLERSIRVLNLNKRWGRLQEAHDVLVAQKENGRGVIRITRCRGWRSIFVPLVSSPSPPSSPIPSPRTPLGNITEQVLDMDVDVENGSDVSLSQPVPAEDLELPMLVDDSDTESDGSSVYGGVQRRVFGDITNAFVGYGYYG